MPLSTGNRVMFSAPIYGGRVYIDARGVESCSLGQSVEDILAELARVPLSKIMQIDELPYKIKRKRRGVPA